MHTSIHKHSDTLADTLELCSCCFCRTQTMCLTMCVHVPLKRCARMKCAHRSSLIRTSDVMLLILPYNISPTSSLTNKVPECDAQTKCPARWAQKGIWGKWERGPYAYRMLDSVQTMCDHEQCTHLWYSTQLKFSEKNEHWNMREFVSRPINCMGVCSRIFSCTKEEIEEFAPTIQTNWSWVRKLFGAQS